MIEDDTIERPNDRAYIDENFEKYDSLKLVTNNTFIFIPMIDFSRGNGFDFSLSWSNGTHSNSTTFPVKYFLNDRIDVSGKYVKAGMSI